MRPHLEGGWGGGPVAEIAVGPPLVVFPPSEFAEDLGLDQVVKISPLRHSSRSLPLKDSTEPLSQGPPG